MKIILASSSPRRRELIKKLNCEVVAVSPDCDEDIDIGDPAGYVEALSKRKALSIAALSGEVVVGADTVVVAPDGGLLGKPENAADAQRMLKLLCGGTHKVLTGVCAVWQGKVIVRSETTFVTFKPYDDGIVGGYIRSGKCFGKAGAYGLQDAEIAAITESVDGDRDNVIGLPVGLLREILSELGLQAAAAT